MNQTIIFLSIPGLRKIDLPRMPHLSNLFRDGTNTSLRHTFPCVTWPSQANMLTGKLANEHGVIANGFYWRDKHEVEMWTAWNDVIQAPQIWDVMKQRNPQLKSAAWFPMLSKGCGADYVCMPAPIHQPDGSEDLWCYTKPQEFYGELLSEFEHFPLQHFWGPLANIKSTKWIADSAVAAADQFRPNFFYIYLPHLDYAAQKSGPSSEDAFAAVTELDNLIKEFASSMIQVYESEVTWMVASEYTIVDVNHVSFPNRILRETGFLHVKNIEGREHLDFEKSLAWALVDHQFSHVFVRNRDPSVISQLKTVFEGRDGLEFVLAGDHRDEYSMNHERSGDIVLISSINSWQAYYWWMEDTLAPNFASTVDIHRKPGYDPIELHFDFTTKSVPLNANLARGSHGAPPFSDHQKGVFLCSHDLNTGQEISDTDIFDLILQHFK